ncbi:MAG TPA: OstA-like protein [Ignavibacteriaceae bacterium]|nr:OstA-like protein [Ignavibacteriaceae bacterium]
MKYFLTILIYLFLLQNIYPQQADYITVVGDSLVGKTINGETVREVYGNVILTQADVIITCNKAIQFIARNEADLIGNVIAKQDSMTITTEEAHYFGDQKKATSYSGIKLDDQKVILTADSGDYFFDEDKAVFKSNVTLFDTTATLTSNELIYYKEEDRMIAISEVKIIQEGNIIQADSLEYFRKTRITFASSNVSIYNPENNVQIFGDHLEDYAEKYYSLIDENPLLIQVDTSYSQRVDTLSFGEIDTNEVMEIDTLVIRSLVMEAWRDTIDLFKATDSVRIVRGSFASKNDFTIYHRNEGKIITSKISSNSNQPILWYENSQLTGDSVAIYLRENQIKLLEVFTNAFILAQNETYPLRFDQTSGERVVLNFEDGNLTSTEIYGGVLSIYYLFEEEKPNGLSRSSSQSATIVFAEKEVSEVRLYGSPASEFYPENQVFGKERTFTLPLFIFHNNRPVKSELIKESN